jgi:hypothetical protein
MDHLLWDDIRFVSLLLIFYQMKRTRQNGLNIQEITYINELALTVGLTMLTIGNFLGSTGQ